jgi:hypothetical protein
MSERRGAVARISGVSGTGKTTLALATAAALAALGTRTCYLSCEEDPRDLAHRILTLTPPFLTRTASFPKELDIWFAATHLDSPSPTKNRDDALDFVQYILGEAGTANVDIRNDRPPGLVPFVIILDGVHELISRPTPPGVDEVGEMRELVEKFRELGVLILILTAQDDEPALREIDYLVDVVITLEHQNRTNITEEPTRTFVLHKTRLQHSWPGAHHLHVSKNEGVKLYPQLPAQLDPYTMWRWKPIHRTKWYNFNRRVDGRLTGTRRSQPTPTSATF